MRVAISKKKLLHVVEEWLKESRTARQSSGYLEPSERQERPLNATPLFPSKHMAFFR